MASLPIPRHHDVISIIQATVKVHFSNFFFRTNLTKFYWLTIDKKPGGPKTRRKGPSIGAPKAKT